MPGSPVGRRESGSKRVLAGSWDVTNHASNPSAPGPLSSTPRGIRSLAAMSNTRMAWLRVSCLLAALFLARPAFADAPSPETTVKDAYAELSALLYAPPSEAREIEIAALIARHTDFA